MAKSSRTLFVGLSLAMVVLAVSALYGVLPLGRIHALATSYIHLGFIDCLTRTSSWISCPAASLPTGYRLDFGLPMALLASVLQKLSGIGVVEAYDLAGILFLSVGVFSCYVLFRLLSSTPLWAIFSTLIFYALPILHDKAGYGFLMWGFVLFPSVILSIVGIWKIQKYSKYSKSIAVIWVFPVMTISIFQEPYSFFMAVVFGMVWSACHIVFDFRNDGAGVLIRPVIWAASVAFAVLLYSLYVPQSAAYVRMPDDFFRGQGIDLLAFVARSSGLFAIAGPWDLSVLDARVFFTDGESIRDSYIGMPLCIGILLYLSCARFWRAPGKSALVAVAVLSFVLSLGPSLKINDRREDPIPSSRITFDDYLMSPDEATFELPHGFVYGVKPISAMRSVSRWHLLTALMLAAMLAVALSSVRYRPGTPVAIAAAALVAVALVEYFPNFNAKNELALRAGKAFAAFNGEAIGELTQLVKPGERVLFLQDEPGANEYLSLYLCTEVGCRTFNAPGDKAGFRAISEWPAALGDALALDKTPDLRATALAASIDDGILDAVVIPHFDMRWNSYSWPPPDRAKVDEKAEQLAKPFRSVPDMRIVAGRTFSVVRRMD